MNATKQDPHSFADQQPRSSSRQPRDEGDNEAAKLATTGMDSMDEAIEKGSATAKNMMAETDKTVHIAPDVGTRTARDIGNVTHKAVSEITDQVGRQYSEVADALKDNLQKTTVVPTIMTEGFLVLQDNYAERWQHALSLTAKLSDDVRKCHSVPELFEAHRKFIATSLEDLAELNTALVNRSSQLWQKALQQPGM